MGVVHRQALLGGTPPHGGGEALVLPRQADPRRVPLLDIGSGSGLHSLAAFDAKADGIQSFDFDPLSVSTTGKLRQLAGEPTNWIVERGDVLDADYRSSTLSSPIRASKRRSTVRPSTQSLSQMAAFSIPTMVSSFLTRLRMYNKTRRSSTRTTRNSGRRCLC